jgi:DNA polymerase I-like protein with 3'-5' exonuclease and polymerase domains
MCYGILYGMGAHSLSEQLEVSPEEAAVFLEKFKQTYKGYDPLVRVRVCCVRACVGLIELRAE